MLWKRALNGMIGKWEKEYGIEAGSGIQFGLPLEKILKVAANKQAMEQ